jgi:hypothetical protein
MQRPILATATLRRAAPWALCFLAALALRAGALARDGVSPDEEITIFAVRGIAAHGLPVLPSGIVYERGLLFSYAAWLARLFIGSEIVAPRMVSLLAGCALPAALALLARRLSGSAFFAGIACCAAAWLVASSTWGRFYAPFVLGVVCTTLLGLVRDRSRRTEVWTMTALAATCLLHETAVVLVALPLFSHLQSPAASIERRRAAQRLATWCGIIVIALLLVTALRGDLTRLSPAQLIAPPVAFRRWPFMPISLHAASAGALAMMAAGAGAIGIVLYGLRSPWVLCIAAALCAATLNLGTLWVFAVGLILVRPERTRSVSGATILASVLTLGLWMAFLLATTAAGASLDLVTSLLRAGFPLPLVALTYLLHHWPALTLSGALGAWLGRRRDEVRAVAFLIVVTLALWGTLPIGPKPRYLLPVLALLLALVSLVPEHAAHLFTTRPAQRAARLAAVSALLIALWVEDRRAVATDRLLTITHGVPHLRTVCYDGLPERLRALPVKSPLVCNDGLLCRLAGRDPDAVWLGSEPEVDAVGTRDGKGWRSIYTDAPIILGRAGLLSVLASRPQAAVVLFDGPKYDAEALEEMLPSDGWTVDRQESAGDVRLFQLHERARDHDD